MAKGNNPFHYEDINLEAISIGLVIVGIIAFLAVALVITLVTSGMLRKVVPTNEVHIVQSKKATTPYGRGREKGAVYYNWPSFLPFIGVQVTRLPESNFDVSLDRYVAYDQGRLPFLVDIKGFFRIKNPEVAAQRVANFDELNLQLVDILKGAVRKVLATNHLEEILQDRAKLGQEFTQEVADGLLEWGVEPVKTIEFMNITDADGYEVIANIMAKEVSRIDRESRVEVASNDREAELREIDARRDIEMQRQDAEQQVGIRTAEKDKQVGIANELSNQEVLLQNKETTSRQMEVRQVEEVRAAEIAKSVAVVKADQDRQVQVVNANADKERTVINADAKKAELETIAQGNLTQAELNAKGIQATGAAEAEARKLMELAPVQAQITLAQEIGENKSYQEYLLGDRTIQANEAIGIENAKALARADIKVIANTGDASAGIASIGQLLSPQGGTQLGGMLEAIRNTPEGKKILDKITGGETAPGRVQLNG